MATRRHQHQQHPLKDCFQHCFPEGVELPDDFKDIPSTRQEVWDWFGDHGAFMGIPMTDAYTAENLTHPDHTPFERLAYVSAENSGFGCSFLALRLRADALKSGRLTDVMEVIMRRANMSDTVAGLAIYLLGSKEDLPEPLNTFTESQLIGEVGEDKIDWWVRN